MQTVLDVGVVSVGIYLAPAWEMGEAVLQLQEALVSSPNSADSQLRSGVKSASVSEPESASATGAASASASASAPASVSADVLATVSVLALAADTDTDATPTSARGANKLMTGGTQVGGSEISVSKQPSAQSSVPDAANLSQGMATDEQFIPADRQGGQILHDVRLCLTDSRLNISPGPQSHQTILSVTLGCVTLLATSPGVRTTDIPSTSGSVAALPGPLSSSPPLEGASAADHEQSAGVQTPMSAADWLRHSSAVIPRQTPILHALSWRVAMGPVAVAIPCQQPQPSPPVCDSSLSSFSPNWPICGDPAAGGEGGAAIGRVVGELQVLRIGQVTGSVAQVERNRTKGVTAAILNLEGLHRTQPESVSDRDPTKP